jgi:hypothetical protein
MRGLGNKGLIRERKRGNMKTMCIRKAAVLLFLVCLTMGIAAQERLSFPGNLSYDPFYAVVLTDSDGERYTLMNASYISPEGENKFFVWFRRGTDRGLAEYPLELKNIRRFELTGDYEVFPDGYTPCRVELTSGSSFEGFLDTSGYIGGVDEDFGLYARVYLQYNGVRSVEFLHDGTYRACPFCGALFYNSELENCPFDKIPLVPQNP